MTDPAARHWRSLDGVRGAAILCVVAYHLSPAVKGGALGVDVFFVLSGFLITSLLLRERDLRGTVSFRAFYARRALRLLPAFYVVLVVAAILAATVAAVGERAPTLSNLPWVFFYSGNLRASYGNTNLGLLNGTWSLAEEEQFYLLFPVLCIGLLGRSNRPLRAAGLLASVAVLEMVYRILLVRHGATISRVQYGPDTRSDGLLAGCALAFAFRSRLRCPRIGPLPRAGIGVACALLLTGLAIGFPTTDVHTYEFIVPLAVLVTTGLLWSLLTAQVGPLHRILSSEPAVWLGRRSYGLYLWHIPLIFGLSLHGLPHAARLPIHLGLSLLAMVVSYRYIEQPFLRMKRRWQPAPASEPLNPAEPQFARV